MDTYNRLKKVRAKRIWQRKLDAERAGIWERDQSTRSFTCTKWVFRVTLKKNLELFRFGLTSYKIRTWIGWEH